MTEVLVKRETVEVLAEEVYNFLSKGPYAVVVVKGIGDQQVLGGMTDVNLRGTRDGGKVCRSVRAVPFSGGDAALYWDDTYRTWGVAEKARGKVDFTEGMMIVSQVTPDGVPIVWAFVANRV